MNSWLPSVLFPRVEYDIVMFFPPKKDIIETCMLSIVCCGMLLIGSTGLLERFHVLYKREQILHSWQQVPCIIDMVNIENESAQKSSSFRLNMSYHYKYNGKIYVGDKLGFYPNAPQRYILEEIEEGIKEAEKTLCYVNPRDPHESMFDPKANWVSRGGYWGGFIVNVFQLGVGLLCLWLLLPIRSSQEKASKGS